jgi:hypothetical protein
MVVSASSKIRNTFKVIVAVATDRVLLSMSIIMSCVRRSEEILPENARKECFRTCSLSPGRKGRYSLYKTLRTCFGNPRNIDRSSAAKVLLVRRLPLVPVEI